MSGVLHLHFANPDDVTFEEFYDFFCTDISNKTKNQLYDIYLKIKGDKDEVSFEDIARFYCEEDYDTLISILDFLTSASDRLEEIYSRKELVNENFIQNMIEKILYYDIGLRMKGLYDSLLKINQNLNGNIKKIQKESELGAKIKDILSTFKQSPDRSMISVQEKEAPSSKHKRTQSLSKVDELQNRLNQFQKEIETLKFTTTLPVSNNNYFEENDNENQEEDRDENNWSFEKRGTGSKLENLTGHVWPKSRMLLAIVSRMSKEGLLTSQQKGILKDLIIEDDPRLLQYLKQYEIDGNRKQLYQKCLHLATSA